MFTVKIAGITYETDDSNVAIAAKHCGPGFAAKIAKKENKIWRKLIIHG